MTSENATNRDPCRLQKSRLVGPLPFEIDPLPDLHQRRNSKHLSVSEPSAVGRDDGIDDRPSPSTLLTVSEILRTENRSRSTAHALITPRRLRVNKRASAVVDGNDLGAHLRSITNAARTESWRRSPPLTKRACGHSGDN